jgi:hypothetical protein
MGITRLYGSLYTLCVEVMDDTFSELPVELLVLILQHCTPVLAMLRTLSHRFRTVIDTHFKEGRHLRLRHYTQTLPLFTWVCAPAGGGFRVNPMNSEGTYPSSRRIDIAKHLALHGGLDVIKTHLRSPVSTLAVAAAAGRGNEAVFDVVFGMCKSRLEDVFTLHMAVRGGSSNIIQKVLCASCLVGNHNRDDICQELYAVAIDARFPNMLAAIQEAFSRDSPTGTRKGILLGVKIVVVEYAITEGINTEGLLAVLNCVVPAQWSADDYERLYLMLIDVSECHAVIRDPRFCKSEPATTRLLYYAVHENHLAIARWLWTYFTTTYGAFTDTAWTTCTPNETSAWISRQHTMNSANTMASVW